MKSRVIKGTLLFAAVLLPIVSSATTIYRYTYVGASGYTSMTSGMPAELTSLSGYIDLAAPMGPGFADDVVPLAFSFTDGVTTLTEQLEYSNTNMLFGTDEAGEIEWWLFQLQVQEPETLEPGLLVVFSTSTDSEFVQYCFYFCENGEFNSDQQAVASGYEVGEIGAPYWVATVVPIPAAVWLFGSGLGLLGWFRRRA